MRTITDITLLYDNTSYMFTEQELLDIDITWNKYRDKCFITVNKTLTGIKEFLENVKGEFCLNIESIGNDVDCPEVLLQKYFLQLLKSKNSKNVTVFDTKVINYSPIFLPWQNRQQVLG